MGLGTVAFGCSAEQHLGRDEPAFLPEATVDASVSDAPALSDVDAEAAAPFVTPPRMACGGGFCCGITDAGSLKCWGENGLGQLGDGTHTDRPTATPAVGLSSGVTSVTARDARACAVVAGAVFCWGRNQVSPSGVVGMGGGQVAVVVGMEHFCALADDGTVRCWGANDRGQLGRGTAGPELQPVGVVALPSRARAISAGVDHTCALLDTGAVACWGANTHRVIGSDALAVDAVASSPTPVDGVRDAVDVSSAKYTTCVANAAGAVACWGERPGNTTRDAYTPLDLAKIFPGGRWHVCGIKPSGALVCWGENFETGVFGDGTTSGTGPSGPQGLTFALAAGGSEHTCAVTTAGALKCWGRYPDPAVTSPPTDVAGW